MGPIDLNILALLQPNARKNNTAMAKKQGMAPSAALERKKKLEARQVINADYIRVNPQFLDLNLLAFIDVNPLGSRGNPETGRRMARRSRALELHHITGEDWFILKGDPKTPNP